MIKSLYDSRAHDSLPHPDCIRKRKPSLGWTERESKVNLGAVDLPSLPVPPVMPSEISTADQTVSE